MVAPRILWRYVFKDVLVHASLGLAFFGLVLVVSNVMRFVEQLLEAGLSGAALGQIVMAILPSYLAYAIPTSLLFGVLVAFGRMASDGEIVAMRSSGVSVPRLLPPVLVIGTAATLVAGYLLFELEPRSHHELKSLVRELSRSVRVIQPGRFRSAGDHRTIYVAEQGSETCPLKGVLLADFSDARRPLYISAQCAGVADSPDPTALTLELHRGSIHFSGESRDRYRRIRFVRMRTELDFASYLRRPKRSRDHTMSELLELDARFRRGEQPAIGDRAGHAAVQVQIHRRLAFPLASILLSLLAVPLGIRPFRTGRSAGALTAVVIMGLYWLFFNAAELAGEHGMLPAWLALWAPNAVVLCVALLLLRQTTRPDP